MSELKVIYRPVEELIGYARNSRTHSPEQVIQVAASIREFGFVNPILIKPDLTIIAGHCRRDAAIKLGMKEVPTITLNGLTDAQCRALVIADNKLAENAGWNFDMLKVEFADLDGQGFPLALTGFGLDEIASLLAPQGTEGLTDPDEVGEAPLEPVSARGDVWLLGNHRLMCGDSTSADDVAKLLGAVRPHLMVTDPPYGVEYDPEWRGKAKNADGSLLSTGKDRAKGKVENDDKADWREAWALFPGDVAYIWHAGNMAHVVAESLLASGFVIRSQIIWAKSHFVIGRGDYHPHHEPCWYAVRKGKTGHYTGDRKQSTLWKIDKPQKSETGHGTQKPVECMKRPIENNSSPGHAVYEPFSGSGTTIIAAEMTGRSCLAMELSPAYVDVAVARWQAFTGQKATRESDGAVFSDLAPSVKLAVAPEPKAKKKAKA